MLRFFFLFLLLGLTSLEKGASESLSHSARLEEQYHVHHFQPSDINEHLPHLRRFAAKCTSVTEIGIRDVVSTWAILFGLSENNCREKIYRGIDLNLPPSYSLQLAQDLAEEAGVSFQFLQGNDMFMDIEQTDMLFIDTLHTYCHLTYELEKFAPKTNRYIALHDTSEPWGYLDDSSYSGDYSEYPISINREKRGLLQAVFDFLQAHPEWVLLERYCNNHGFVVLERKESSIVSQTQVNEAIENKMILCTGPALGRKQRLQENTESDLAHIPFKKIFLTTNDSENLNISFGAQKTIDRSITARGHQLDCLNCILLSIKSVLEDPECFDDDIILFKHESLFINDMHLVRQSIRKILEGYNMVVRYWTPDSFYMTNAFFLKVGAARQVFHHLKEIETFNEEYRFCEDYFTKFIVSSIPHVYQINYSHLTRKDIELGLFHIPPPGEENREGYWDKKNYNDLFSPSRF